MSSGNHGKINLSLKDVKHLQVQFSKAATDKLNLYLPTADESDPLKGRVSSLVNDFIYEIFEASKDSLDIDELKEGEQNTLRSLLENPTNEVEPFDFSLQDQVRKAYQEVERETIKLTKMRREKPLEIKQNYEDSFNQSLSKIDSLQKELHELQNGGDDDNDNNEQDELDEHEKLYNEGVKLRLSDLIADYEESLGDLKTVKDVLLAVATALPYSFLGVLLFPNTKVLGASLIKPTFQITPTYSLPTIFTPFGPLILISIILPGSSFFGHLFGLIAGYALAFGYLGKLAPPSKVIEWIETKLDGLINLIPSIFIYYREVEAKNLRENTDYVSLLGQSESILPTTNPNVTSTTTPATSNPTFQGQGHVLGA
ncbi:Rhomboid protein 2 [Wickerhamomyces ciferrii]|uniref:Rhomboid protein 2 n=1 Tax=Wickerhamomyces ciferrii (strain ATCC 14091 / BCRC 22168 / CBS 111 / JCM 3599 / NBRC 0793 / NRRL Y-1031 F-60-10) TaxID=1206466 RepID=K0KUI2_WICCF|nr:Rhomboid protein 2 [Wickerhamomyces ciferrii]CCH45089.1 Rhomboid protein 2 [Wickerhamomyces ciferrii]